MQKQSHRRACTAGSAMARNAGGGAGPSFTFARTATERRPRDSGPGMGPRGTRDRVQEGGDPSRRTTRSTGRSPRRSCRITHRRGTSSTNSHRQTSHRRHQCPPPPAMAPTRSVCPGGTPTADRRSRSRRRITPRPSPSLPRRSATRVTSARSTCWSWWVSSRFQMLACLGIVTASQSFIFPHTSSYLSISK